MNEQSYEPEINLGRLFYRIFRDWRNVFVVALIIALLTGAGNFILKKIKTSDLEYIETAEQNYERELAAFHAAGETLQREIENLEETRQEREVYNETSILMKINPYREFNASLQLYIATDYQIVPELTYQNIDLSNRILRSYVTYMVNGDMYQYILEHLSQPLELRYLKEILTVSADYDNRMVNLNVRHVDAQACEEILQYAMEGVLAKQPEIAAAIGGHELNTVNQSVYETVNLDLDEWQKGNQQYMLDLSIRLQEKADAFSQWLITPEPQKEYTISRIVRDSIKKMVLGFIVGAVLAAVFIAFRYIMSDKLQDAKELKNRFGLRVIAQVPVVHKKRVWVGFDRLFARMGGLVLKESDAPQLAMLAAQSVCAELTALDFALKQDDAASALHNLAETNEMPSVSREVPAHSAGMSSTAKDSCGIKLAFTGNAAMEEMERLLSKMRWEEGYSVQSIPNILCDPAAVPAVMAADYVVLVEKQEESTYTQIERELEELAAWKKKVLGVIVIGVDAVP